MSRYVVDDQGWLRGPGVLLLESPLRYARLQTGRPIGLVWHYTGGAATPGSGLSLARSISSEHVARVRARGGKVRDASWHVLVTREGSVIQSVSFMSGAWHCAQGSLEHGGQTYRVNQCTASIELENAGWLRKERGRFYRWSPGWLHLGHPGYEVPRVRVASAGDRYWDDFTPEQVKATRDVVLALVERYPIEPDRLRYEHRNFDPARKVDPGDLWVEQYLPQVLEGIG